MYVSFFNTSLLIILNFISSVSNAMLLAEASRRDTLVCTHPMCRCFPGDECWPPAVDWAILNNTLGGKLIATVPIASVCHDDPWAPYEVRACMELQTSWSRPETHLRTPSSPMAHFFANMSCDPFTPRDAQCSNSAYVQYAVNASSVLDYQVTLKFAQKWNVRLVIRSTGHDYFGKSSGAGGLALWTHYMRDIFVNDYESSSYKGKAMKIGAGVMNYEAQLVAHKNNLVIVGGYCPTLSLSGGYTQGGGYGPLVSTFGLGADQVLEWEVVTGTGAYVVASPSQHSDLYWALSGGGGGTYGIVVSMTVKAHPDIRVSAANLTFSSQNVTKKTFYDAVEMWLISSPASSDAGATSAWILGEDSFVLQSIIAPGITTKQLQSLLQPVLDQLEETDIEYKYYIEDFPNFLDAYEAMIPSDNITEYNIGGRFIPRSLVSSEGRTELLMEKLDFILRNGAVIGSITFNVSHHPSAPNSVNTVSRETSIRMLVGLPYDPLSINANIEAQERMTNSLIPVLEALTPGGGAYLNEANFRQPDFQQVFYGQNYEKLLSIKRTYDPNDLFYGLTAVGSHEWEVQHDGRLCRREE